MSRKIPINRYQNSNLITGYPGTKSTPDTLIVFSDPEGSVLGIIKTHNDIDRKWPKLNQIGRPWNIANPELLTRLELAGYIKTTQTP